MNQQLSNTGLTLKVLKQNPMKIPCGISADKFDLTAERNTLGDHDSSLHLRTDVTNAK